MTDAAYLLRLRPALLALALLSAAPVLSAPSSAAAQEEEARLLFERGNQHLTAGLRARGRRRTRELEQALDAYLGVLRLGARTRNVVFNLGITLQELDRPEEAFNYFSEYLRSFDLSAEDRAAGEQRLEALRPEVAVLRIESTPPGAAVRVDRRDLPPRGTTPLEIAVAPGTRRLILSLDGYGEARAEATVAVGSRADVAATLSPEPVSVQVIAPGGGRLTLDDREIVAGRAVEVAPGAHVVRLEVEGAAPVERRFEVAAGSDPMVLELSATGPGPSGPRVALDIDTPAQVFLDGLQVGAGMQVEIPASPGDHEVRVVAPGRRDAVQRISLTGQERLHLDVTLGRGGGGGGLIAGRVVTAILALGGLGAGVALLAAESDAWSAWQNDYTEENADRLAQIQLGVDVTWSITAAVGLTALVLLFVDEGADSTVELGVAPAPGGGALALRGRLR